MKPTASYLWRESVPKTANREWHQSNTIHPVSDALGVIIMSPGILVALYLLRPELLSSPLAMPVNNLDPVFEVQLIADGKPAHRLRQ